jgi:hypothetical protein
VLGQSLRLAEAGPAKSGKAMSWRDKNLRRDKDQTTVKRDKNDDGYENLGIFDFVVEPPITVVRIMYNRFPMKEKFKPSGFALQ